MNLPTINIGSKSGKFKYILVQLKDKFILRGDPNFDYHNQIFEKLKQDIGDTLSNELKVLGGGKIQVDFENKTMNIFGDSQSYGAADHTKAKSLLQEKYSDFNISIDQSTN